MCTSVCLFRCQAFSLFWGAGGRTQSLTTCHRALPHSVTSTLNYTLQVCVIYLFAMCFLLEMLMSENNIATQKNTNTIQITMFFNLMCELKLSEYLNEERTSFSWRLYYIKMHYKPPINRSTHKKLDTINMGFKIKLASQVEVTHGFNLSTW